VYEITTMGDVAQDPAQASQPAQLTPASLTISDRASSLVRDVVAQRTGLLVGLAVGAAGALLYTHLRR
jgi:hypothetical protein